MLSERFVINDAQWALMEPHCFGKKRDPGRTGGDSRLFSGSRIVDCSNRGALA